jgi:hypothetical protein
MDRRLVSAKLLESGSKLPHSKLLHASPKKLWLRPAPLPRRNFSAWGGLQST